MELLFSHIIHCNSLNKYFSNQLEKLNCDDNVKSYIISIFTKYHSSHYDLSKDNITIKYCDAKLRYDFESFQTIGDWLFFATSIFPQHFDETSINYYYSLGQSSYFYCHRMIKQFKLYELLADDFVRLSNSSGKIIIQK